MEELVINIFILLGSVRDIKTRRIPVWYLYMGLVMSAVIVIIKIREKEISDLSYLMHLLPGIIFLLYSHIKKEGLGYGDGILLCILGICLGVQIWWMWYLSLLLICGLSLILLLIKKINMKTKIAYYPFVWLAHSIVWGLQYV